MTPLTRVRLGALSKPLTAAAVALLYEGGRLDLDAPIQRYVPAYPEKPWTVTTRQCGSLNEAVAMRAGDPAREPFDRFMVREVFEPLAMGRTLVADTNGTDATPTYGPRVLLRTRLGVEEGSRPEYSCLAGAGAFLSTPTDLVRFGSAMLRSGLLEADTIAAASSPLASPLPPPASTSGKPMTRQAPPSWASC